MSAAAKRAVITPVLGWMVSPVTVPPELDAALDAGLAKPGAAFFTRRPFQLALIVEFVRAWKALPAEGRDAALADPWAFKSALFAVHVPGGAYTQREALLHLVFPDTFEATTSREYKDRIASAFVPDLAAGESDVDRRLLAARQRLGDELGRSFDWYEPDVVRRWRIDEEPPGKGGLAVGPRAWVSQSNPAVYRLTAALAEQSQFYWLVNQHADEIHGGDRVYLWETGPDAGFVAVADIAAEPAVVSDLPADRHYWVDGSELDRPRLRAMLRITQVLEPRLSRATVLANDRLTTLENVRVRQGTNFPVTPVEDTELQRLLTPPSPRAIVSLEALSEATGWDSDRLVEPIAAIRDGPRQVVLAGPPGTGKTYVAQLVARYITAEDPDRVRLVQFHPSYSYEQFIEGLRPLVSSGTIGFDRVNGIVLDVVRAMPTPDTLTIIVIDEMNRANLSKVFGAVAVLVHGLTRCDTNSGDMTSVATEPVPIVSPYCIAEAPNLFSAPTTFHPRRER